MKESEASSLILSKLSKLKRLWIFRNNVGQAYQGVAQRAGGTVVIQNAVPVRYGLGTGSGDYIGFKATEITADMVGKTLAVFVSVEVKASPSASITKEQLNWQRVVQNAGGHALIVCPENLQQAIAVLS